MTKIFLWSLATKWKAVKWMLCTRFLCWWIVSYYFNAKRFSSPVDVIIFFIFDGVGNRTFCDQYWIKQTDCTSIERTSDKSALHEPKFSTGSSEGSFIHPSYTRRTWLPKTQQDVENISLAFLEHESILSFHPIYAFSKTHIVRSTFFPMIQSIELKDSHFHWVFCNLYLHLGQWVLYN